MANDALLDPFMRLLADRCSPADVRAIEAGGSAEPLWAALAASGYLDALVPEAAGGAGLSLADIGPLLLALGGCAMPLPVAETMVARALIAAAGGTAPDGAIVLLPDQKGWPLLGGATARWALSATGGELLLAEISQAVPTGEHWPLAAHVQCLPPAHSFGPAPLAGLLPLLAVLRTAAIAGAGARLLDMTVAYANDRVQFGKPIGKQQAVQQQLAVMAEHVIAARIAAQIGCAAGLSSSEQAAATAKHMASTAACEIAAIAHGVHGAIGISADYDLHLLTRRLHAWRLADGSESYWARRLGAMRFAALMSSADFMRGQPT